MSPQPLRQATLAILKLVSSKSSTPASAAKPAKNAEPILAAANKLRAGYGSAAVCGEVSFALRPRQALALIGPNGAGKSTVLKTVVGALAPVAGTCTVFGAEPDDRSLTFRRDVAVVLDEDAFFPSLTVSEHLAIIAAGHGVEDVAAAIENELEFFGLAREGDSLPHSLSSGQRRRLLLAAAFVRPKKLLVLDEPEQRLDTTMRAQLADRLSAEVAGGIGLLLVTHDPAFLLASATAALSISDTVQSLKPAAAAAAISAADPMAG